MRPLGADGPESQHADSQQPNICGCKHHSGYSDGHLGGQAAEAAKVTIDANDKSDLEGGNKKARSLHS